MLRNACRLLYCGDGGARTGSLKQQFRFRHLLYGGMWCGGCRRLVVPWWRVCDGTSGRAKDVAKTIWYRWTKGKFQENLPSFERS